MGVLFMIVMLTAITGSLAQSCDPFVDCSTASVTDLVADPTSCSSYYVCVTVGDEVVPSDSAFQCDVGLYFNGTACTAFEGDTCYNACANHCDMVCDSTVANARLAVPGQTDRYNLCVEGTAIETACPADQQYFNGVDCVADSTAVCDFCSPHCGQVGIQVPDPNSCRRFYICTELGNPDWNLHGTCKLVNQVFSAVSGKCVTGTQCSRMC